MSFLNSVLSSISGGQASPVTPVSQRPQQQKPAITDTVPSQGAKRKAERELPRPVDKIPKTDNSIVARDVKPLPSRPAVSAMSAPKVINPSKLETPVNDTRGKDDRTQSSTPVARTGTLQANPSSTILRTVTASSTSVKPVSRPEVKKSLPCSRTAEANQVGSMTTTSTQPKRGSFKDIMARAKQAAQAKPGALIIHKPAEKLSAKKELALAKKAGKPSAALGTESTRPAAAAKSGTVKDGRSRKSASPPSTNSRYQGTSKSKVLARPQPTYQGTGKTRPQPTYQGTARPGTAPKAHLSSKPSKYVNHDTYLGTDEEDEGAGYGYDDEDQYTEVSEDYSDMDAGFDELDEEERRAERQAKLDDLKEQKLLDKLAREKELKKKRDRA